MVESLLIALGVIIVPTSIALWIFSMSRLRRREPLLNWRVRRPVPWTILDMMLIGAFGVVVVSASSLLVIFIHPELKGMEPDQFEVNHHIATIIAFACSSTLVAVVGLVVLRLRAGATLTDLGLNPASLSSDSYLGLVAFVMLVVPMLAIQYVATKLINTDERHMFIDLILENPNPYVLIPITFAAVIVAPIVEEFLFRLLLQGWLERVFTPSFENEAVVAELVTETPTSSDQEHQSDTWSDASTDAVSSPQPASPGTYDTEATTDMPSVERRWIPIVVSSIAFSLAHFGQGAAPIALFFLALGLGYIYQRTHRILPCIVIHFLVNLLAMAQLAAYIIQEST